VSPPAPRQVPKRDPGKPAPDPRIWGRFYRGPAPWVFGLIVVLLLAAGVYMAFAKKLPFTGNGYELTATFENAASLRVGSPVRIAGVNVGKVTSVEGDGDAAKVTFTVADEGQPIHDDAQVSLRPRLFLEGNFFLDLKPGSPSAPALDNGQDIPITQTSTAVQLDEVLTSLQQPSRRGLQRLLEGYGTGLTYQPTPADDADQDPIVAGETAAKSLNDAFRYGGDAGKGAAIVNTALLGEKQHDLSGFIDSAGRTFEKLAQREGDLSDLITNFNTFSGALASESANLSRTFEELAPTLEEAEPSLRHLNDALPAVRTLAIESQPGIEELPTTIDVANPWLDQSAHLLRRTELGGLAALLKKASPGLAKTAASTKPLFDEQTDLAKCASNVFVPAGNVVINDQFSTGQPNYREFFYSAVQQAGESQGFDGNGPYLRFQSGGGPQLLQSTNPAGGSGNNFNFSNAIELPDGNQPPVPSALPPFRMDVPCKSNQVPAINGPTSAVGPTDFTAVSP
jgi:ABC-type transporter Mla subunit MlaD